MGKKKLLEPARTGGTRTGPKRAFNPPAHLEPRTTHRAFPVVAIGASAGGLEAMTQLLKHLPARTGMAFVLVQHLDPTHESALTSLLSRLTEMPVIEARNNMPLLQNQICVIPPNKMMGISHRRLKLSPRKNTASNLPIDQFFGSLAEEEGNRAVGVILSGNGSDGTRGLEAIKAAGGITLAQDEKSAKYPAMPGNAITAGCVDFVLTPERMALELARISGHPYLLPGAEGMEGAVEPSAGEPAFAEILSILRTHAGVDFTYYKHATLRRRIQRRMMLHKIESLKVYSHFLRSTPAEVAELFNDILIHVTGFFRDPGVFNTLKKKLFPRMVSLKRADEPIRIWVTGCSTGEEVYSIAIVLMEFLNDRKLHHPVQIFGTDIRDTALEHARAGTYPEDIKADVSPDRLRRFFIRTADGYRVNKVIREMCIFSRQNVVADPPFSNLDLISCRNVLIYLGLVLQRKVMPLFHYALKNNAFLMLGASETIGSFSDLFALLDKKAKVYTKKSTLVRPAVSFLHHTPQPHPAPALPQPSGRTSVSPSLAELQKQADRVLLTHYDPVGVIIDNRMDVLHFLGRTAPFLEHSHGDASLNLLEMAREGLALELRTVVSRAIKRGARVRRPAVRIRQNGNLLEVALEVIPFGVPPSTQKFYLVLFRASELAGLAAEKRQPGRKERAGGNAERAEVRRLQAVLAASRESLQTIVEEQEATVEELRSANEEITSSNEELQSTNEEMETAKEELQSTNEELTTLNDELESRNAELEHVNNDLHNVLSSVNIPIIILGPDLRIRRFTSIAEKLFNLIPGDVGRPITDINLPLDPTELSRLVLEVIDHLTARQLEIKDRSDHWWSVRIRPYKTTDNRIDGAVVALLDIDLIKSAAEQVNQGRALADALINGMAQPVLLLDDQLTVQAANQAFFNAFQLQPRETLNHRLNALGNGEWEIPKLHTLLHDVLPHNSSFNDFEVVHNFIRIGRRKLKLQARRLAIQGEKLHVILLIFDKVEEVD